MGREHWVYTTLGQVVTNKKGKKPKRLEATPFENSTPYIDIEAFETGRIKQYADCDSSTQCNCKDILVVWDGARFGLAGINQEGAVGSTLACLSPIIIESSYLYKFIQRHYGTIQQKPKGMATPHVDPDIFWNLEFPLPPLEEQKHIIEKLNAILPKVKSAKVRLEKIPGILKSFRQSVLAAACSGRLTEEWRAGKDLPDWREKTIREIAVSMSTGPFGSMLHSYDYIDNGIPVINPTNIKDDKIISDNTVSLNQHKAEELSRYKLQINDILLARRGDLSKCGIVTEKEVNWIAGTGLFILRAKINPKFFKYTFGTDGVQSILNNNSVGSTMLNLNQKILGDIKILLPSPEEQGEIVRRVEKLFLLAHSLEVKYKKAMEMVEKIEQSILAKAFRGELVESDPGDEPAEELLKRIVEEKAKLHKNLRRFKGTERVTF